MAATWIVDGLAHHPVNVNPLVVGDPPDWYTGPQLHMEPSGGRVSDTRNKFRAIIESELVAEAFVLFADDNVVVRPIEFVDLQIPRVQPARTSPPATPHAWQQQRWETAEFCRSLDIGDVDASTHWPYCWDKSKLVETLDLVGDRPFLVETVYANQHCQATNPATLDFRYLNHTRGICEEAKIVSYNDTAFQRGLRSELRRRFPDPSPWDTGPVPSIPTLGVIDHARMHACESLGKVIRVEGKHVIFSCSEFGEAALFTGHTNICDRCDQYHTTKRIVTIGRSSRKFKIDVACNFASHQGT